MDIEIQEQIADSVKKNVELYIYNIPKEAIDGMLLSIYVYFHKTTDANGNIISDYAIHLEKFKYLSHLIKPCLSYNTCNGFPILKLLFNKENHREFKSIGKYIEFKLRKCEKNNKIENTICMDGDD